MEERATERSLHSLSLGITGDKLVGRWLVGPASQLASTRFACNRTLGPRFIDRTNNNLLICLCTTLDN